MAALLFPNANNNVKSIRHWSYRVRGGVDHFPSLEKHIFTLAALIRLRYDVGRAVNVAARITVDNWIYLFLCGGLVLACLCYVDLSIVLFV